MCVDIEIFDTPKRLDVNLLESAIRFYACKLMTPCVLKKLTLELMFVRGLRSQDGDAMMYWDDQEVRPREFTIEMDKDIGVRPALVALAHEIIHVKQYATGVLQDGDDATCFWKGIPYDLNEVEYKDLPWEIEAFSQELDLYNQFKSHMEKNNGKAKACKAKPNSKRTCKPTLPQANC